MSIALVMPSDYLILCHPLLFPPLVFPSLRVFPVELVLCIRWPKYWSLSFSISPSSEYSGLISFRIDWFDLLAVQGTLKSLLQHHSSKASILWRSAFFIVQLSHPYMTAGKTIALARRTFVGRVMSLLLSMLSRLVTAFLPLVGGGHRPEPQCHLGRNWTVLMHASVSGLPVLSMMPVCLSCTSTTFSISVVKKRSLYLAAQALL